MIRQAYCLIVLMGVCLLGGGALAYGGALPQAAVLVNSEGVTLPVCDGARCESAYHCHDRHARRLSHTDDWTAVLNVRKRMDPLELLWG